MPTVPGIPHGGDNIMEIRPGLHRIVAPIPPRFIAMHLFTGPNGALLFDTGVDGSVEGTLLPYLRESGIDPASIRWVVSSHCDFDHTGGNAALKAIAPGAEFLARADGFDDPPGTTAEIRRSTRLVGVDGVLVGGEAFDLGAGRMLEIVAVPGHSPGHLAVWDEANSALAISDAVLGETVPTADGEPAFPPTYRDTATYVDSIERVRGYGAQLLLTAHYPVYEGGAVAEFLDVSLAYTDRIDRAIEKHLVGEMTSLELIHDAAADLGPWPRDAAEYLIFPLTGNLERLSKAGRVAEGLRGGTRTWRWI
jgi:glyoxylase-like metal-dependent hydrolase (beta-lactamase superfamily II)